MGRRYTLPICSLHHMDTLKPQHADTEKKSYIVHCVIKLHIFILVLVLILLNPEEDNLYQVLLCEPDLIHNMFIFVCESEVSFPMS